jgi:hypothetical protein
LSLEWFCQLSAQSEIKVGKWVIICVTKNLKERGISTVRYKVNDVKFKLNLEEEEELLQKIAMILIAKSGKTSPDAKSKI